MAKAMLSPLELYKISASKAARELCYGEEVVKKIQKAETEEEIITIMTRARKEKD